jgi:hypothetical protein
MKYSYLLFFFFIYLASYSTQAQGENKYITFSGFVIDSKTEEPLPNAYISIPEAGRGTIADARGYFILYVFPEDSIVFSYVGFKPQYHKIPKKAQLNYSAVVELQQDAKLLKEVKVYPFSTEEEFKEALVKMELPDARERAMLEKNYSREKVAEMVAMRGMSADMNYRYAMSQQLQQLQNRGQVTLNPLLNPFSWGNFIKSVKSGAFTDKSWKGGADIVPREPGTRDNIFRNGGN